MSSCRLHPTVPGPVWLRLRLSCSSTRTSTPSSRAWSSCSCCCPSHSASRTCCCQPFDDGSIASTDSGGGWRMRGTSSSTTLHRWFGQCGWRHRHLLLRPCQCSFPASSPFPALRSPQSMRCLPAAPFHHSSLLSRLGCRGMGACQSLLLAALPLCLVHSFHLLPLRPLPPQFLTTLAHSGRCSHRGGGGRLLTPQPPRPLLRPLFHHSHSEHRPTAAHQ